MATLYGVNSTKRDVNVPPDQIPGYDQSGRLKVFYDEYTLLADLGSADVINLMKLPKGCRVLDAILYTDAMGGSCACKVGWAASSDAAEAADDDALLAAATSLVSAARKSMAAEAGRGKVLAGEVQVQLTTSAVSSSATGNKLRLAVIVAMP